MSSNSSNQQILKDGLVAPLRIRDTCGLLLSSRRPEDLSGNREGEGRHAARGDAHGTGSPQSATSPAVSSGASGTSAQGHSEAEEAESQEDSWMQISKNHRNVRKSPRFKANTVF